MEQPEGTATTSVAVYSSDRRIALYDVSSDSVRPLTQVEGSYGGPHPRFRHAGWITFADRREPPDDAHTFGQDSLYAMDLRDRDAFEILRLPDRIEAYGWSPNGRFMVYQMRVQSPRRVQPTALCMYDSKGGRTSLMRRLAVPISTATGQREERSVAWSPDGSAVLVVHTQQTPSIYVVDSNGDDLTEPRRGSFARWLLGGRSLLFQEEPERFDQHGRWFQLDVRTGRTSSAEIPRRSFRPALSPDGSFVAFDDGDRQDPATYVLDRASGRIRRVAEGYAAPIWLSSDSIAVTAAGPCPPQTECNDWWTPRGETVRVELDGGGRERLELPTTLHEARVFSTIDVLLAEA